MLIALILAWTINGHNAAYPPVEFQTVELCEAAMKQATASLVDKGAQIAVSVCVLQSVEGKWRKR